MKQAQVTIFIILGLVILLSFGLSLYLYGYVQQSRSSLAVVKAARISDLPVLETKRQCIDGTDFGFCSKTKPLWCNEGRLEFNCESCGCLQEEVCRPSGECAPAIDTKEVFTIFFVPINYNPDDVDFRTRVEILKAQLVLSTNLREVNFLTINRTFAHPVEQCDTAAGELDGFVDRWYQSRTGESLPGLELSGGIPVYHYRIIGIDKETSTETCGCSYTVLYSPSVYIGGQECGRVEHAALHELGHTFGLCDEYDTCVWEETDAFLRGAFGHPCLNSKPTNANSDCTDRCCSDTGVCCLGKYADVQEDNYFNIMGSGDVPPSRRTSTETSVVIDNFLCDNLGVCA